MMNYYHIFKIRLFLYYKYSLKGKSIATYTNIIKKSIFYLKFYQFVTIIFSSKIHFFFIKCSFKYCFCSIFKKKFPIKSLISKIETHIKGVFKTF